MPTFDPEALKGVYDTYADPTPCKRLTETNHRQVVEWRWATGDMFKEFPFEKELYGNTAKWLKEGQKPKPGHLKHGLDAEGKIIVMQDPWFNDRYEEKLVQETHCIHEQGRITRITFQRSNRPKERTVSLVCRTVYDEGRLARIQFFSSGNGAEESFFWTDDRLTRSVNCSWNHDYYSPGDSDWAGAETPTFVELTYEYDEAGQLDSVWEQYLNEDDTPAEDCPGKLRYRQPRKGETIPALSSTIEAMLLEQIPRALRQAKIDATVYCLLICYCGEDFGAEWPPFLVLGNETERQRIIAEGTEVQYYLWAPDELRSNDANFEVVLQDPALVEKCELHAQLMSMKNSCAAGRKVLRNVAQQLNQLDWDAILSTTDDFTVAIVDNTGERPFDKDIRDSISAKQLAALKSRSLL